MGRKKLQFSRHMKFKAWYNQLDSSKVAAVTVTVHICQLDMTETTAYILDFGNVEEQNVTEINVPYCRPRFED